MLPLARASGAARATGRSACANRLLRARGASRRSTAVRANGCRPPPAGTALAPPAGVTGRRPLRSEMIGGLVTESETGVKDKVNHLRLGRGPSPRRFRLGPAGASPLGPDSDAALACREIDAKGQERYFAPQKNSKPFRRRTTVKSVADLPIGAYILPTLQRHDPIGDGSNGIRHSKARVHSCTRRSDRGVAARGAFPLIGKAAWLL